MAEALRQFPRDVALRCVSAYGVARKTNPYIPNVPQAIAWCEEQASTLAYAVSWEKRAAKQWAEATKEEAQSTPRHKRKTYAELQADCAAVGIFIGKNNPYQREREKPVIPLEQLEQEAALSMDDWMAKRGYK